MKIAYLEITTWLGSIGAEHYYGKIVSEGEDDVKLTYRLSKKQAKYLTGKDLGLLGESRYKRGQEVDRFESEEAALSAAKDYWKEHLMDQGYVLIKGRSSYMSCQKLIAWPDQVEDLCTRINEVVSQFDSMGGYCDAYPKYQTDEQKAHDKKVDKVDDRFMKLLDELRETNPSGFSRSEW